MDKKRITDITFGVLYKKSFRIMDVWGSIVDEILEKKPYFSREYFPLISSQYTQQGRLSNDAEGHYLILTADTLIYKHKFQKDFEEEYSMFCDRICKYIIPNIIYKNKLDVLRLGVVYTYSLTEDEITRYAANWFNPNLKGINDFRFSRKEPTIESGIISGKSDYINKIFTVGSLNEGNLGITYDYQLLYNPPQECVNDKISKFLENGNRAFEKDIIIEV